MEVYIIGRKDNGDDKVYNLRTDCSELYSDICNYCRCNPLELGYKVLIPNIGIKYLRPEPSYWTAVHSS